MCCPASRGAFPKPLLGRGFGKESTLRQKRLSASVRREKLKTRPSGFEKVFHVPRPHARAAPKPPRAHNFRWRDLQVLVGILIHPAGGAFLEESVIT